MPHCSMVEYQQKVKMFARKLVLLLCTFGTINCIDLNSTIFEQLPEVLSYLCPGVEVCGKMYETSDESNSKGFCCTACSCEPSCEITENCCFPSQLPYAADNVDLTWLPLYQRECLYPTTLELDHYQRMLYQPYFMITSVPNDLSCGDTKIFFWGSLYPIYSASRNQIYKNIACATADGVRDGIPWDVILDCNFTPGYLGDENYSFREKDPLEMVHQILENNEYIKYLNCHVNFMLEDISMESLKCYTDVRDNCPESGSFQVPDGINYSAEEIVEACLAGLSSPYLKDNIYANVFCFICDNEIYSQDDVCYEQYTTISTKPLGGGKGKQSFIGLVDMNFVIKQGSKDNSAIKARIPLACDNNFQDKRDCRPIHCPLGQLPDRLGKCKHSISKMYDHVFHVTVNVTTDVFLNITDLIHWSQNGRLISPWPEEWQTATVRHIETPLDKSYTHLIIKLYREIRSIRTADVMKKIKRYATRKWILKNGKASYIFHSALATWDYVWPSIWKNDFEDVIRIGNRTRYIALPNYSVAYLSTQFFDNFADQIISRLHFCKLVELTSSEFVFGRNKIAIFYFRTQLLMFALHSFAIKERTEIAGTHVQICLEDSGLSEESQAPIISMCEVFALCMTFAIISKWLFLVMS